MDHVAGGVGHGGVGGGSVWGLYNGHLVSLVPGTTIEPLKGRILHVTTGQAGSWCIREDFKVLFLKGL